MEGNQKEQYEHYTKVAWVIYVAVIIALILVLVFVVAGDNEERIFFSMMTVASAYVFRPTERFFARKILKYTGVAKPEEEE